MLETEANPDRAVEHSASLCSREKLTSSSSVRARPICGICSDDYLTLTRATDIDKSIRLNEARKMKGD